ncbi:MAG: hypothetical protein J0L82_00565 [Deltaproteobacteria bacterium]|nr:hypothetical protein [Deltaproteobacteria bacterium]
MKHEDFLARLALEYPKTAKQNDIRSLVIPTLIAPLVVDLPGKWLADATRFVEIAYRQIRDNQSVGEQLRCLAPEVPRPDHSSALMSYDFHVDFRTQAEGQIKLIEINTNASMSLLLDVLNCQMHVGRCLKESFLDDFAEDLGRSLRDTKVVIIDESPMSQKLYVEFLMYKELFESRGAAARIADRTELAFQDGKLWLKDDPKFGPIDLVYNRLTDFYFETAEAAALQKAMRAKACVISPHPFDYRLLADKARLVQWCAAGSLESYGISADDAGFFRSILINTRDSTGLDPEQLWKERKGLIFKPKTSHGGKGVYRGSSVSRGAFQSVIDSGALAQDFIPAPTLKLGDEEFKYDLRFFAYKDRINIACARLYQGQMTNATTPGGGVAAVSWS